MKKRIKGNKFALSGDVSVYVKTPHEIIFKKGFLIPDYYRFYSKELNLEEALKKILFQGPIVRKYKQFVDNLIEMKILEINKSYPKKKKINILVIGGSLASNIYMTLLTLLKGKFNEIKLLSPKYMRQFISKSTKNCKVDFLIFAPDHFDEVMMEKINDFILSHKIPSLFTTLEKEIGIIGPLVIPFQTACLECFRTRVNSCFSQEHLKISSIIKELEKANLKSIQISPNPDIYKRLISDFITLDIRNFLYFGESFLLSQALFIDFRHLEIEVCYVLKNPLCKKCGRSHPIKNLYLPLSTILKEIK